MGRLFCCSVGGRGSCGAIETGLAGVGTFKLSDFLRRILSRKLTRIVTIKLTFVA